MKNPAKEKTFEKYFLPHWQACLAVWLYNFLSIAVQQMDKPKLVVCVEKALKRGDLPTDGSGTQAPAPGPGSEGGLTDDFAVIAQYVLIMELYSENIFRCGTPGSKTSSKSLRSILKNIAGK